MNTLRATLTALYALMHIGSVPAFSADNELYDAPPPDDAAFVRWVGLGNQHPVFGVAPATHIADAYRPVSAAATTGAQPGAFYTATRDANGKLIIIEEPARQDKSKVHLLLLNASDTPAHLVVAGQDMMVIDETQPSAAQSRAVNPVSTSLTVKSADGRTLGTFDLALRRGQNLTFIVHEDTARLIENAFGPNLAG